jgi:hypothetical protein
MGGWNHIVIVKGRSESSDAITCVSGKGKPPEKQKYGSFTFQKQIRRQSISD